MTSGEEVLTELFNQTIEIYEGLRNNFEQCIKLYKYIDDKIRNDDEFKGEISEVWGYVESYLDIRIRLGEYLDYCEKMLWILRGILLWCIAVNNDNKEWEEKYNEVRWDGRSV